LPGLCAAEPAAITAARWLVGLERKFDAVGYGIFIPIFFISSGMTLDLKAIARDPLRLLIFFALLLIVRGLPSLLVYRRTFPARQRVEMTFITATTLPLGERPGGQQHQFAREDGDLPEVAPDLPHPGAYRSAARAPGQRVAAVGAASYSADMVVRTGKVISARWLARAAFALVLAAAADLVGFADLASLAMVAVGAAGACLTLAGGYWFLAHRGVLRWVAFAVVVLAPVTVLVIFALHGLLWVALVAVALIVLAAGAGRRALAAGTGEAGMPSRDVPPPRHAFLIMNPRSGGGKVARFGLKDKAEALGAEVALLDGPGTVDVAALARQAVAGGADLLGVAGGDGTQALVAGIAAEHALPFLVISAGTRNHFALDLGLDRENPAACLDALSDGVEQRIDLGVIGDRTFVNNASFGAYAEVVRSPAYRDDKRGTTLQVLPELLSGHRGATLTVRAGGVTVTGPQAVLVSNNAYEMGDIAGLGHRARLDAGTLGIVVITVNSAMGAVGLLGGGGVMVLAADEVVVDADEPEIPVGIDGETVMMPTPVRCAVRPQALRVRVPRDRPGVRPLKPRIDWSALRKLASLRSADSRQVTAERGIHDPHHPGVSR
jgi:diacylglycerol kinase family enzyme